MSKNLIQFENSQIWKFENVSNENGGKQTTECFGASAAILPRINVPIWKYANVPMDIGCLHIFLSTNTLFKERFFDTWYSVLGTSYFFGGE